MAGPYDIQAQRQKFLQGQRENIDRNARAQQQEQDDTIQRRFAALGQAGSGAAVQAGIKGRDAVQAQANEARNQLAGQELQLNEGDIQREFQAAESSRARGLQDQIFRAEQGNKLKELDLAERQFLLDKDTTEFNKRMAEIEAGRQDPGLLGQGGFLGTGIGKQGGFMGTGMGTGGPVGIAKSFVAPGGGK